MMRLVIKTFPVCTLMLIVYGFSYRSGQSKAIEPATVFFKEQSILFAKSTSSLEHAIQSIKNSEPSTIIRAQEALTDCRIRYKRIEFFLAYFFPQASLVYNAPAKYEVEEPSLEYREPVGLQVIENLMFEKDVELKKDELLQQVEVIGSSAYDLNSLLYNFKGDDKQLLESIRIELIRITALNISGYDAPLLKTGIKESAASLMSIEYCLKPYLEQNDTEAGSLHHHLKKALNHLRASGNFDTFDRLSFLTDYAIPLMQSLSRFISNNDLYLNTAKALDYQAGHLFDVRAIKKSSFPKAGENASDGLVELGRRLFAEKGLSGNNNRSCKSCHQPSKYFTDGMAKSIAFDDISTVSRNAPSLLYAGLQYAQFWDGRSKSLEEQVMHVIKNPAEMSADYAVVTGRLKGNRNYSRHFEKVFPSSGDSAVSIENVAISIAAFIRSLTPMNSAFDKYIQGDHTALTPQQINGYNLFMGKAQCGTCHFAPLFNGLIPPLYERTELEVLGTPEADDFEQIRFDRDSGRFSVFPSRFYIGAFKTPTVRNAAVTAPYMHNGSFKTLEKVVDFYNKGGGAGLGLKVDVQTLSSAPLRLDDKEVKEIVSFLTALTDSNIVSKFNALSK